MKPAIACCSILALALATYSLAQTDGQASPDTFMKLFKVGDHIGFTRSTEMSGYVLYFSSETEIERAKDYFANQQENEEQMKELSQERRLAKSREQHAEISKKMSPFLRPRTPIGRVIAIGKDFVGITRLDGEGDLYIPIHSVVGVIRKANAAEAATE